MVRKYRTRRNPRAKLTLVDVGQDTTLSNRNMSKQLVQFLIVADGKLEMARNDTGLLVVTGSVASQLQDFSGEILKNSGQVNRSTYMKGIVVRTEGAKDKTKTMS